MKRFLNLLILTFTFFIISCDKESKETTVPDFQVDVDAEYITSAHWYDAWVFLHDENGNALDHARLVNGRSFKFNNLQTSSDRVGITVLTIQRYSPISKPFLIFESFLSVGKHSQWKLKDSFRRTGALPTVNGNAEIFLEDEQLGHPHDAYLSTGYVNTALDESISTNTKFAFSPVSLSIDYGDLFLYVLDKNRVPRYKFIENLTGGPHTFTLSDFSTFETVIDFNFPTSAAAFFYVKAFSETQSVYDFHGYTTNFCFGDLTNSNLISSFKAGFLNRYPKYVTVFGATYPPGNMEYEFYSEQAGPIPSSLNLPLTLNPILNDKSFGNYSFTVNEDFVFLTRYYTTPPGHSENGGINWKIHSNGDNNFKNPIVFPQEFLNAYPEYSLNNLAHEYSRFYKQFKTVDAFTAERFQDATPPETYVHTYKALHK